MKKLFTLSLLSFGITFTTYAQHQPSALSARHQKMLDKAQMAANTGVSTTKPIPANKGTGIQKERVKAIFVNYGSGDDSLKLYYGSNMRGSSFNYEHMGAYDGGYNYLNNPLAQMKYDSLDYITRTDHSSAYSPYLQATAQYDAQQQPISGRRDNTRFQTTYNATGDVIKRINFTLNSITNLYDTTSLITTTYLSAGKALISEAYSWSPAKTGSFQGRTVNDYDGSGNLTSVNIYDWDTVLHNWATLPAKTIRNTYIGSQVITITNRINTLGGDTTQTRYTYNANNQIASTEQYLFNRMHLATGGWDTLNIINYTYTGTTADWTKSKTYMHDPTTAAWGFVTDTMVRVLDAQNQIISITEYNNDGQGNVYTYNNTQAWYASGKRASNYDLFIIPGVDTFSIKTVLTFSALGNPATCKTLMLDAYGGINPDTITNTQDRYYYETYIDPTSISPATLRNAVVNVFPNPVNNNLHLSCATMQEANLTLTNVAGQTVRNYNLDLGNNEAVLTVSDLPAGVYVITLTDVRQGLQANAKFIKQ